MLLKFSEQAALLLQELMLSQPVNVLVANDVLCGLQTVSFDLLNAGFRLLQLSGKKAIAINYE